MSARDGRKNIHVADRVGVLPAKEIKKKTLRGAEGRKINHSLQRNIQEPLQKLRYLLLLSYITEVSQSRGRLRRPAGRSPRGVRISTWQRKKKFPPLMKVKVDN